MPPKVEDGSAPDNHHVGEARPFRRRHGQRPFRHVERTRHGKCRVRDAERLRALLDERKRPLQAQARLRHVRRVLRERERRGCLGRIDKHGLVLQVARRQEDVPERLAVAVEVEAPSVASDAAAVVGKIERGGIGKGVRAVEAQPADLLEADLGDAVVRHGE